MEDRDFWAKMSARTRHYDLLCHPFYTAWTSGALSQEDLREYAAEYYHHVAAFPGYLAAFAGRLPEGELRQAVMGNFRDEMGLDGAGARPHHALWLQFAEAMGAKAAAVRTREPLTEVSDLIRHFRDVAINGNPAEALAALYAYESQVPRVAREKELGLRNRYRATPEACAYFTLHTTADVHHSRVWREQLDRVLHDSPELADKALQAAESAARALWRALDGVESARLERTAA